MASVAKYIDQLILADPLVKADAADALQRISKTSVTDLDSYIPTLLEAIRTTSQPSVQWHLAELIPNISWTNDQATELAGILTQWCESSPSSIVKADALTAMARLGHTYPEIMSQTRMLLAKALKFGSAAEKARVRKLVGRVRPAEL